MSNYTPSGNPVSESRGVSSQVRAEFILIQTAITSKGDKAGQTWTGAHDFTGATPTFTTQTQGDNSTKPATTAYADAIKSYGATTYAPINSPTFTGTVTIPGGASITGYALLNSPAFTGTPTVPTAAATTSTTQAASTAMVQAALVAYSGTNLGLPAWTGSDALKTVRINSGGTGYEWVLASSVTETLTNKTLTGYTETVYALSGTDINPANGTVQTKTLSTNTTFTESIADGQSVVLMLNPSTYTTTWPTTSWVNQAGSNTAPTLKASVVNVVTLWQVGGVLYGNWAGSL